MRSYQLDILGVTAVAVLGIGYTAARGLFRRRERPDRIIGQRVRLKEFEEYRPQFPDGVFGTIRQYAQPKYLVEFDAPVGINGFSERYAWIQARHTGYPVSSARTGGFLAVSGEFESGTGFVSLVTRS